LPGKFWWANTNNYLAHIGENYPDVKYLKVTLYLKKYLKMSKCPSAHIENVLLYSKPISQNVLDYTGVLNLLDSVRVLKSLFL
jgi:hypothetical protein